MDLGLYPQTETGSSLLGSRPSRSLVAGPSLPQAVAGREDRVGTDFLLQAVSSKPPNRAWSPCQGSGALVPPVKPVSPVACIDLSDLGAGFVIFFL